MHIYNTLSRSVEVFTPVYPGKKIGMYCCGPTVYDYTHLGHLWKYTMDDTIRRILTYLGYQVTHVMNITDVGHLASDADEGEDKLEKGAQRTGKSVWEVARYYTEYFDRSMRAIGILHPHVTCKATEHITDMVALIQTLEKRGFTYDTSQALYFDTSKFAGYGALSGQKLEEKKQAVREGVVGDEEKKHPHDFALWFKRTGRFADHTMHWESPWGDGFPGWHIECSAMSMKYLGPQFDIHTGGIDHIPVHHANEIAQSEAATGQAPFVRYWVHHNFVQVEGQKMSKSLGNFLTIDDVMREGIDPYALRLLFLQSHYRSELNFTWEALRASEKALIRLREAYHALTPRTRSAPDLPADILHAFEDAISHDFNTAQAVGIMWSVLRDENDDTVKRALIERFNRVFGLDLGATPQTDQPIPSDILALGRQRQDAKQSGDYTRADALRDEITSHGYLVVDHKDGTFDIKKV